MTPEEFNRLPSAKPEASISEEQRLTKKFLIGMTTKRSDEEWEFFEKRTIEMFQQKGLFQRPKLNRCESGIPQKNQ